jgi:acyl-CoA thioester hydrolase
MAAEEDGPDGGADGARGHETAVRVRYDEVDRMGVVHHPRYLVYFEVARTEYLRSLGGTYRALEDSGTLLMVVEAAAKYRRPARYDDLLAVRTRLVDVGPVRLRFEYEVLRGREVLATGHTVLAACDRAGRPTRIPDGFRATIGAPGARTGRGKTAASARVQEG